MKTEDIKNCTDEDYQKAMVEMVQSLLEKLNGHDALFGMQALMATLGNVAIDTAPSRNDAVQAIMGLSISTVASINKAYDMMEDEDRLEGEENANHEIPFRLQ